MADHTPKPDFTLLSSLAAIAGHHGKRYCYPAQDTLRRLHAQHTAHTMSTATLNRKLRALVDHQLIHRRHRHHHDRDYGWQFRSTLYTFTRRATRWLTALGARLRAWPAYPPKNPRSDPSLNTERQSVSLTQYQVPGALKTGPPEDHKKVALRAVDNMRAALLKK